jgi:SAM-dependent methyltransferase
MGMGNNNRKMDVRMLWNDRFTKGLPSLEKPDPFFITMYELYISFSVGRALDLAAGLGRHSLYLADRQWQTTAIDISEVAIEKLKVSNPDIDTHVLDIADYQFASSSFDLIVLYYHFDRTLFKKIFGALKPGGLFICKLAVSYSGNPDALQKNELLSLVAGFELIHHAERPVKDRGVVEYLGKKH